MKYILIILIVLTPTLASAQWEQMGDYINGIEAFNYVGTELSMSSDGKTIAIIYYPYRKQRYIRIYNYTNNNWNQIGKDIKLEENDLFFQYTLSLNSDGTILAIGNYIYNEESTDYGFVNVYHLESNQWIQLGETIENDDEGTILGTSLSVNSDGTTLAIKAKSKSDNSSYSFLKIFQLKQNNWEQLGETIQSENLGSCEGNLVRLNSDGTVVTFAIPNGKDEEVPQSIIRVYEYKNQNWVQLGYDIENIPNQEGLEATLDLSSDGTTLAIGSPSVTSKIKGEFSGEVKVYKYYNDIWIQLGKTFSGKSSYDRVGEAISISSDGNTIAFSTPGYRNLAKNGKVDIYRFVKNEWLQMGTSFEGGYYEESPGKSIDLSSDGNTIAIGVPSNDTNGTSSGQVRVFKYNPKTSVYESADDESLLVYPNPTKGEVNIKFTEHELSSEIKILDLAGKQVYTTLLADKSMNIDISGLICGVYYIHIKTNNGSTIKKIIKE